MKFIFKLCIIVAIICVIVWGSDKFIKEKIYPKPYNEFVKEMSQKYDIEENLIYSIIKVESNFKANATSKAQAKGLMQIVDGTANEMSQKIGIEDFETSMLYIPEINIEIGTKYISTLVAKYGDIKLALIAYNAGQGNLDKWIKEGIVDGEDTYYNLPYAETTTYWQKVIREYKVYNRMYEE